MARFGLSDENWVTIAPLSPELGRGAKRGDGSKVLDAIFNLLRTGAPWRDLPDRYGPRMTVYNRYVRWGRKGVWKAVFDALVQEADDSLISIDSSMVKAHRAAAGSSPKDGNWQKGLDVHATAALAAKYDLGVNAGHDLTVENLPLLAKSIPELAEVSIGHGLTADALIHGYSGTVKRFLAALDVVA